ncbi:hypothetical protein [Propionibacterium australiense]|uniref:Nitrogenase molybdenum iron protein domain-containing protein n=1 Tax=Propionibacterium australiense TaxID=119981 RepID=A0A383S6Y5_9ACTN|nr:hypothetical protein [Propionibacterium australiense]RLP08212.1 hypothetical protein D7U36_10145 [Propionibacterium australiense]RLP08260.1 hypothetical protein D9T14_08790 [Propionibacterium australiense]SYZ33129.1 Nitrogenase molybdenum iron protein domain-containing protein [Propionibacterium australiense]VEH89145.1 proposed F420-0 ABC transporter, periplasmic F420-0 binding protein [Propionibacterium australiense]
MVRTISSTTRAGVVADRPGLTLAGCTSGPEGAGDVSSAAHGSDDKTAHLESSPVTAQMDAVRNKRYVIVPGSSLDPSMRTVDLTEALAGLLAESA